MTRSTSPHKEVHQVWIRGLRIECSTDQLIGQRTGRRIFEYAFAGHTLDSLGAQLAAEGMTYVPSQPRFSRSKLYAILRDRSYIGEIQHQGQWYRGTHEALIDRTTWDRVQVLLGEKIYQSHDLTYRGEVIVCGACGNPITGERKTKKTKNGPSYYTYYRCSRYNVADHPRVRLTESQIDEQVLGPLTACVSKSRSCGIGSSEYCGPEPNTISAPVRNESPSSIGNSHLSESSKIGC